jgi:hypothetical protein
MSYDVALCGKRCRRRAVALRCRGDMRILFAAKIEASAIAALREPVRAHHEASAQHEPALNRASTNPWPLSRFFAGAHGRRTD